jgi:hypothetical protein
MKQNLILALLGIALLSACTHNKNGKYVVYSIRSPKSYGDTIADYLTSKLQGASYDITFHDKYVSLVSTTNNHEMVLSGGTLGGKLVYNVEIKRHDSTYKIRLTPDSILRLDVTLFIQQGEWLPSSGPINNAASFGPPGKESNVTCLLAKKED